MHDFWATTQNLLSNDLFCLIIHNKRYINELIAESWDIFSPTGIVQMMRLEKVFES